LFLQQIQLIDLVCNFSALIFYRNPIDPIALILKNLSKSAPATGAQHTQTIASVSIDAIHTGATMMAVVGLTFVVPQLAMPSVVVWRTVTVKFGGIVLLGWFHAQSCFVATPILGTVAQ